MNVAHGCGLSHEQCASSYGVHPDEAWFLCTTCLRDVGYCMGGEAPGEELCANCWSKRFARSTEVSR